MCANSSTCCITAAQAGQRLDVAVGLLFPAASARARRRLWDSHSILVNGKARPCGFMVRQGDELCACPLAEAEPTQHSPPFQPWLADEQPPRIVAEQQNLLFVYKPSGLHTAHLAGRSGPSLEAQLPALLAALYPADSIGESTTLPATKNHAQDSPSATCAEDSAERKHGHGPEQRTTQTVRLVNRLDCGTSGLVVAARDNQCAAQWQAMENAGLCEKHYLTLLCGHLPAPIVVRNNLDVDSRRVTKVLPTESNNSLRHSRFTPMGSLSADELHGLCGAMCAPAFAPAQRPAVEHDHYTVAVCTIAKGARHQIRAHASHAGFPLWGDSMYSSTVSASGAMATVISAPAISTPISSHHFLLHHGRLVLAGAVIHCLPVWLSLLPQAIQGAVHSAWPCAD